MEPASSSLRIPIRLAYLSIALTLLPMGVGAQIPAQTGWPLALGTGSDAGVGRSSVSWADLDGDGDLEVVFGSRDAKVYALHHDGEPVAGWPVLTGSYVVTTPAIGDMDNDGWPEVAVVSNDGRLHVWRHDGTTAEGWPVQVQVSRPHSGGSSNQSHVVLADVTGDGFLEAVCPIAEPYYTILARKVAVFGHDGTMVPGWPQPFLSDEWTSTGCTVADLDGDGSPEILAGALYNDTVPNHNRLYAWHGDGTPMEGWPVMLESTYWEPFRSIVVGDVDNDGHADVVAADRSNVYVLDRDGTLHPGWPIHVGLTVYGLTLALGDVDGDGDLEIAVASDEKAQLRLLHHDAKTAFTVGITEPSSPALADIDGDPDIETIVGRGYQSHDILAFDPDGSLVSGFKLVTEGWIFTAPSVLDIDGDGDLEVAVGDFSTSSPANHLYVWDAPVPYDPARAEWPTSHGNTRNTGEYRKPEEPPVAVRLLSFDAVREGSAVRLSWTVAGATPDHAGFFVHREDGKGERVQITELLPGGREEYGFVDEAAPTVSVHYWLAELSRVGTLTWYGPVEVGEWVPVRRLHLAQNAPNPFQSSTRIGFALVEPGEAVLEVFNPRGGLVAEVFRGVLEPGPQEVEWDGRNLAGDLVAPGVYFYRLRTRSEAISRKLVVWR